MDGNAGVQTLQTLWINWTEHIESFHEEAGYERLEFPSAAEKMEYAFQKGSIGFRIQ